MEEDIDLPDGVYLGRVCVNENCLGLRRRYIKTKRCYDCRQRYNKIYNPLRVVKGLKCIKTQYEKQKIEYRLNKEKSK